MMCGVLPEVHSSTTFPPESDTFSFAPGNSSPVVISDFVISKAIQKRNPDFKYSDLKPLEDKFETMAREAVFKKLEI